jgi:hypothetical protein
VNRRTFLAGAGGAAIGALGLSRLARIARGDAPRAPTRLVVIHKPNGTVPANYDIASPAGALDAGQLSYILAPFYDLVPYMVVLDGLDIMKQPNTPNEDHGNAMVTFMTGGVPYKANATNIALASLPSVDQLLAQDAGFVGDAPIGSLQLACDTRSAAMFTRTLSYAGPGAPLPPEQSPTAAYARVFGSMADARLSPGQLAIARARQQSILDFSRGQLGKLSARLGGGERARLDRHLASIREVERLLDRGATRTDTGTLEREVLGVDQTPSEIDRQHLGSIRAQLALVRVALQCDLTRLVTFAFASGQSAINFGSIIEGVEPIGFHLLTHAGRNKDADETAVHRWYNMRIAEFVRSLRDTVDIDGRSLLDNTLVVVWSEIRLGIHTFDHVPIQLFGGAGGRLAGGRLVRYSPDRPTNDMWLAIMNQLGSAPRGCFGDAQRCTGPLDDLFAPALRPRVTLGDR